MIIHLANYAKFGLRIIANCTFFSNNKLELMCQVTKAFHSPTIAYQTDFLKYRQIATPKNKNPDVTIRVF